MVKTKYTLNIKRKLYYPKTVKEAIDLFQIFLEVDAYSKLRPEHKLKIKGKTEYFIRKDYCKNEKEFVEYLKLHFNIFRKDLRRLGVK